MQRRDVLLGGVASAFCLASGRAIATSVGAEQFERQKENLIRQEEQREREFEAQTIARFPFRRVVVPGGAAYSTWQKWKLDPGASPVIVGNDQSIVALMDVLDPDLLRHEKSVPQILDAAAKIRFPADLILKRKVDDAKAAHAAREWASGPASRLPTIVETRDAAGNIISHTISVAVGGRNIDVPMPQNSRVLTPAQTRQYILRQPQEPVVGTWPESKPDGGDTWNELLQVLTEQADAKLHIAIIPTSDWTEIPAYLHWGDMDDSPPPEYHVAVLRRWREDYGIELVALTFDTMIVRVARPPQTRDSALRLAREQYVYCRNTIDTPKETYSTLAAQLMSSNWWLFWWH